MTPLFIIPARGGSKGIPHKNIKPLGGRPLIEYSLDVARALATDLCHIIVSTDDTEIARVCADAGVPVPFMRPAELSTDKSGTREVIIHAMDYADSQHIDYDCVVLLQPTSPFREVQDVTRAMALYRDDIDMVVTVIEAATNPYYNSFEPDADGFLKISKGPGTYTRRQDAPRAWEYNGAVYVINPAAIRAKAFGEMTRRLPSEMDRSRSIDLDTLFDWMIAEHLISERKN